MVLPESTIRIIFGLKLKELRTNKNLSLAVLAEKSGLSISYINEIEKGKKYPKAEKIMALATALDTPYDKLVSLKLTKNLAPVTQLLQSPFFKELPLEMFGIDGNKLVEIIANAPAKVNAFISTLIEIARNYDLSIEQFYMAAVRSYQESNENYFDELEKAAEAFAKKHELGSKKQLKADLLQKILEEQYHYIIDSKKLAENPELGRLRSVLLPGEKPKFLIHNTLSDSQKAFLFGREIGYNYLKLKERAYISYMLKAESFDEVLNNFKASYFSSALLINKNSLIKDVQRFIVSKKWDGDKLLNIMNKYTTSPETFMHRLTNILPKYFGLSNLFFLRFTNAHNTDYFVLTKEMHLSQLHNPHESAFDEHYCRRWVSLEVLKETEKLRKKGKYEKPIIGAQISKYHGSENEYFVIAAARPMVRTKNSNCSVSIGFLLNNELKKRLKFWNDPNIPTKIVNETCERCPISDCKERAVPASVVEKEDKMKKVEEALEKLSTTASSE